MSLFKMNKKKLENQNKFDQDDVIREILETKDELCPGWNFFQVLKCDYDYTGLVQTSIPPIYQKSIQYNKINGDFLAIYTDVINREINIKGNPFSEYKKTIQSIYQIVREIYITELYIDSENDNIYKRINAKSAKELFMKLKKELE